MTRKWLFTLLAVISAEFGLTVKLGAVVAGLGSVVVYVFNEADADREWLKVQMHKWADMSSGFRCYLQVHMLELAPRISEQATSGLILELGDTGQLANLGSFRAHLRAQIIRQTPPPCHKYVTDCV